MLNVHTLPTGDDVIDHIWSAATPEDCARIPGAHWWAGYCNHPGYVSRIECEASGNATGDWTSLKCVSVFLRNAVEISDDFIGNDNGLCETGETCMFTPNIGAYQGHGRLVSAGAFTNGLGVHDVTLVRHELNGY